MIYKFKSPATGDLIMLGEHGDQLLRLLGREPAARGIFEAAVLPAAVAALEAAVARDEAVRDDSPAANDEPAAPPSVRLRQRVWPMVEMMKRALAEEQAIVWGV